MTSFDTTMIIVLKNGQRIGISEEVYSQISKALSSDNIPQFITLKNKHIIATNMIAEIRPDSWAIKGAKDDGQADSNIFRSRSGK